MIVRDGEQEDPIAAGGEFVPCPAMRYATFDARHMHTCTLDVDHMDERPEDGHVCPCGWFWHD